MKSTLVPLKLLCHLITKGTTPTSIGFDFADAGIGFLRVQNISGGTVNFEEDTLFIEEQVHQSLKRSQIIPGDVLLSIAGSIGRTGVVPENAPPLNCNQAVAILRTSEKIHRPFLRHWLECEDAQKQMRGATVTGTIQNLSLTQIGELKIPLPTLPEQRRIAAILDQADALRTKRRETLAQLDSLTQSIFIEMFGDPATNPKGWTRTQIQSVCGTPDDIKCGPFGTQLSKSEVTEEGIPLWGIKNVNAAFQLPAFEFLHSTTANRLKAYDLTGGDIVMTRKGTIGNCAVYPDEFPHGVMHSDLLRIRTDPQRCLPVFLSHQLHHSKDVERQLALISGGAVMPGINVTKLKGIEVLVPPIELQQAFVDRSAAVEEIRRREDDALDDMNGLFHSLQHRAFRGEL